MSSNIEHVQSGVEVGSLASGDAGDEPAKGPLPSGDKAKKTESHGWWKFEITPSVLIAFVALVISVVVAGYNLYFYIQGPRVEFFTPKLISFRCSAAIDKGGETVCADDAYVFVVATSLTYLNTAPANYSAVLFSEEIELTVGSKRVTLDWFYTSDIVAGSSNSIRNVAAELIPASGALVHERQFFPLERACQLPCSPSADRYLWKDFVAAVSDPSNLVSVDFTSIVRRPEQQVLSGSCAVYISDAVRDAFRAEGMRKTRVSSLTCRPLTS